MCALKQHLFRIQLDSIRRDFIFANDHDNHNRHHRSLCNFRIQH